ncbi:hypothetical protein NIES4073_57140 [Kalymmatonema gypsitolerans NIES-4073]|nr:hypothetical protein NIES4073_57140 [Scytonema sp. NIES-4073]
MSTSNQILYGVNLLQSNAQNREDQTPPLELSLAELETGKALSKTNVPTQSVDNPLPVPKEPQAFFVADSDRVTKLIVLGGKTLVTSTVSNTRNGNFNHLVFTTGSANNPQFRAKKVLGLEKANQTVESLLSLPNNQLLCLVGTDGIPPFAFRTLDLTTGQILSDDELGLPSLPPNNRFANLCQDLQGNIFATETSATTTESGVEQVPTLISMNLQRKSMVTGKVKINRLSSLNFEGRPLLNDVKDLVFSSSGQLYALATDDRTKNNALFTVDVKTGKMELVRNLAVERFAFSDALNNLLL